MSNKLVKITKDLSGEEIDKKLQYWHLVISESAVEMTFCDSQVFGSLENDTEFEIKYIQSGGITCPDFMEKIRMIKKVKL